MLEKIKWENSVVGINELNNFSIMDEFPSNLYNDSIYYITYYICPDCGRYLLYKIKARGIKTIFNGEVKSIFNIFTCPICKRFYASVYSCEEENIFFTSTKLSDFALRSISYSDLQYVSLINDTEEITSNFQERYL